MIRFKQKIFFWPLLLNGALAGSSLLSYGEQKKADEENQEAADRQAELMKEQNRRLEKISEKVKENPSAAGEIQSVLQPNGQPSPAKEKFYALISPNTIKNAKLFLKDTGKIIMNHKDHLAGMAATGVAMGAAGYGANKYIQHDMKKNNLEDVMIGDSQQQKSYAISAGSVLKGITRGGKFIGKTAKNNWKSALGWGVGFGAVPAVMQYNADKQAINNQINSTVPEQQEEQRAYASVGSILKGITSTPKNLWNSTKSGWKVFRSHPGQSILGGISNFSLGGGKTGVKNIASEFGKGESSYSKYIASKMTKVGKDGTIQPTKLALAASIPVGLGIMKAGWDLPQKAVEKTTRAIDPNAYKYQDAKNQQMQQQAQQQQLQQ